MSSSKSFLALNDLLNKRLGRGQPSLQRSYFSTGVAPYIMPSQHPAWWEFLSVSEIDLSADCYGFPPPTLKAEEIRLVADQRKLSVKQGD